MQEFVLSLSIPSMGKNKNWWSSIKISSLKLKKRLLENHSTHTILLHQVFLFCMKDFCLNQSNNIQTLIGSQNILNYTSKPDWITQIYNLLSCCFSPILLTQRHSNASQSLCEIIRLSRDQMFQVQGCSEPDPLLATLEKYAFVYLLELLEAVLYRKTRLILRFKEL